MAAARRRKRAQPARPGRRGGPHPDPRRRRRLHRARRPGQGPDGRHRQGRRGVGRPAALPLRHQGAALRRGADLLPRGLGRAQPAGAWRSAGDEPGRAAVVLPRPVPAQRRAAARTSGCSGRSSPCSASAQPAPRQGRRRALRGPLRHRRRHRPRRARAPASSTTTLDAAARSPRPRSRCATGSAPGCWPTTPTSPSTRRATSRRRRRRAWSATTARCRRPAGSLAEAARMTAHRPRPLTRRQPPEGWPGAGRVDGPRRLRLHPRRRRPPTAPLPKSAKAKIDGDLVYFNWADYLDPSVLKGFQKEYGVKIIESNFDSMEGMYAKIAAGNQYDIVFPIAKWVVEAAPRGQAPRDRPRPAHQRRPGLLLRLLLQRPVVRRRSRRSRCRSPSTRPASAGAPTRSTR